MSEAAGRSGSADVQNTALRATATTRSPERYAFASISCGRDHTLTLLDSGRVFGWGGDGSGRIPSSGPDYCSPATASTGPVEVDTRHRLVAVAAGEGVSLGITEGKRVAAWGASALGIGDGRKFTEPATPELLAGLDNICAIGASEFLFGAIDTSGTVHTWGLNGDALGRPTSKLDARPRPVRFLPQAKQLTAGKGYMLALTRAGELYAWGNNAAGQLGLGHLKAVDNPQPLASKIALHSVAAGASHVLAITARGELLAWGSNHHGQLGQKNPAYSISPLAVELPERVLAVAAGMHFSLALGESGSVYAWGWNALGQLGLDDHNDRLLPTRVSGLEQVQAIAAGQTHAAALTSDGLFGWGNNASGQIGKANLHQAHPVQLFPVNLPSRVA